MKLTSLSGWLIAIGVFLIGFKIILNKVWSEAFMINLMGGNTIIWGGIGLIVIGIVIMLITKKDNEKKEGKRKNGKKEKD